MKRHELLIHTQQHRWISIALNVVKEVKLERLHTIWFHLYGKGKICWKRQNYRYGEQVSGCLEEEFDNKWQEGTFFHFDGNIIYLDWGSVYKTMNFSMVNLTGYKLYFNKMMYILLSLWHFLCLLWIFFISLY